MADGPLCQGTLWEQGSAAHGRHSAEPESMTWANKARTLSQAH